MLRVMLSFLSTIRVDKDTKKVITKDYHNLRDGLGATQTTNESAVRWLLQVFTEHESPATHLDYYLAIASDSVRNNYVDIPEKITHYQYFERRMQEILDHLYGAGVQNAAKTIIKVDYDEKSEQDKSLTYVLNIIDEIKTIQEHSQDGEVDLYLDLTGGLRDANMLMLIISRMLAYDEKIHVREVLYSNLGNATVQNISNTYNLLNLVAGISEFVNFGSMKALKSYFSSVPQQLKKPQLQELLESMDNFAKMAMLCRYGEFTAAITRLKLAISAFREYCENNSTAISGTEILLHNFLDSIEQKYILLFKEEQDNPAYDLKLIRWCYENNYIQQAMTLITERIPEYLFSRGGIIKVSPNYKENLDVEYKEYKKENSKKNYLKFSTWLMFESHVKPFYNRSRCIRGFKSQFNTQIDRIRVDKKIDADFEEKIENVIKENNCQAFVSSQRIKKYFQEFLEYYKAVDEYSIAKVDASSKKLFINQHFADIPKYQESPLIKFLKDYTQGTKNSQKLAEKIFPERNIGNYTNIEARVLRGEIYCDCDERTLLDILYTYYQIKEERNAVNHAHNKKEKITLEELLKKIEFLITGLEKIENERKIKDADGAVEEFTAQ